VLLKNRKGGPVRGAAFSHPRTLARPGSVREDEVFVHVRAAHSFGDLIIA
jgi:hypothetical protein